MSEMEKIQQKINQLDKMDGMRARYSYMLEQIIKKINDYQKHQISTKAAVYNRYDEARTNIIKMLLENRSTVENLFQLINRSPALKRRFTVFNFTSECVFSDLKDTMNSYDWLFDKLKLLRDSKRWNLFGMFGTVYSELNKLSENLTNIKECKLAYENAENDLKNIKKEMSEIGEFISSVEKFVSFFNPGGFVERARNFMAAYPFNNINIKDMTPEEISRVEGEGMKLIIEYQSKLAHLLKNQPPFPSTELIDIFDIVTKSEFAAGASVSRTIPDYGKDKTKQKKFPNFGMGATELLIPSYRVPSKQGNSPYPSSDEASSSFVESTQQKFESASSDAADLPASYGAAASFEPTHQPVGLDSRPVPSYEQTFEEDAEKLLTYESMRLPSQFKSRRNNLDKMLKQFWARLSTGGNEISDVEKVVFRVWIKNYLWLTAGPEKTYKPLFTGSYLNDPDTDLGTHMRKFISAGDLKKYCATLLVLIKKTTFLAKVKELLDNLQEMVFPKENRE